MRFWFAIVLALVCGSPPLNAQDAPLRQDPPFTSQPTRPPIGRPGSWPDDLPLLPPQAEGNPQTLNDYKMSSDLQREMTGPTLGYMPLLKWLGLRQGATHGRFTGRGDPLIESSWLNRPYYVGGELGTLWILNSPHDDVSRDVDAFGGIFLGWNRDPYWGAEVRFDWATPEFINREARDADRNDSMFMWSYNLIYYPWGDARWRPYWRAGIGSTMYDFPLADGTTHDQQVLTFPWGVGVKYPIRRWLAARVDLTDHVGIAHNRVDTQNNITLTMGLEWHFGAHPRSYWPWQPSRHIW